MNTQSKRAPDPVGPYPHARRVGNLVFTSGLGPREPGTNAIPPDFAAQCRSVLRNVRVVLEDAGTSWDKIVDVTVFLTNMKEDWETYNRIYGEHFPSNPPTRTTVEVTRLPTDIRIELKVIATID